ncbi:MAG: ZIP family metal transporter [Firmicutes bacterium]|nr:ZIP family metal transporter [Bacillota bacterium]
MNTAYALLATFVVGLFILIGYFIVIKTKNNHRIMNFSISIAFGVMSALALLELLPESYEHLSNGQEPLITWCYMIFFIVVGICILKFLDIFVPDHHEDEKKQVDENHLTHIGIVSSVALVLHNIIEGMAIYTSVLSSTTLGLLVCLGVGLHNIPMGMVITSTFYTSSKNQKKTLFMISIISISTFIGGLIMMLLNTWITDFLLGILLSITTGMIIYIVLFELLPHVFEHRKEKGTFFGILLGVITLLVSLMLG